MTRASGTTVHLVDASPYIFRAYYALPKSILTAASPRAPGPVPR